MEKKENREFRFGKYFHVLSNKLKRLGDENLAKNSITLSQLRVLVFISHHSIDGAVLQNDVEKEFGVRRSSVTSILKNMEKSGLIRRFPDKTDARLKKVEMTEMGKKTGEDLKNYIMNVDERLLSGFSPEEVALFRSFLERTLENAEKLEQQER